MSDAETSPQERAYKTERERVALLIGSMATELERFAAEREVKWSLCRQYGGGLEVCLNQGHFEHLHVYTADELAQQHTNGADLARDVIYVFLQLGRLEEIAVKHGLSASSPQQYASFYLEATTELRAAAEELSRLKASLASNA